MNRYCTKCGNPLNEGDHFCSKCGTECKEVNTNVSPSIQSGGKKLHPLLVKFKSLPIWVKLSYIFAFTVSVFLITYSLFYNRNYDYYISTSDVTGYVCCYDDLGIVEQYDVIHYNNVENIGFKIEHAKDQAKYYLDRSFEHAIVQTLLMIICLAIINLLILKFKKKLKVNKYKFGVYSILSALNILLPFWIFVDTSTSHAFYFRNSSIEVSRTFLSDISAIKEHASEYGLSTEGCFKDIEQLDKHDTQSSQSSNSSSSNTGTQEGGSFVYYEDVQEIPQSSGNSYYEDNTNNNRQTEYQEPCRLCGGDGKCYNARARSLAEMEMYCNGTGSCPKCHGKTYVNNSYEGIDSPMKCTYCNGTGICPQCHGTKVCNACHGRGH